MGVLIGAGVVPIAMAIMWRKANRWACTIGAVGGTCAAVSLPPLLLSYASDLLVLSVLLIFAHTHFHSSSAGSSLLLP
jgi:hypothetical protein